MHIDCEEHNNNVQRWPQPPNPIGTIVTVEYDQHDVDEMKAKENANFFLLDEALENLEVKMDDINQLCENADDFVKLEINLESKIGELDSDLTEIQRMPTHYSREYQRKENSIKSYYKVLGSLRKKQEQLFILQNEKDNVAIEKLHQTLEEKDLQIQQLQRQLSELQLQKKQ
uniref:Uncharacterized protein n=1 Tax=Panagrolaimus sp. ES5 TaxID=591445 RepID=A0AC34G3E2_9BILA